MENFKNNFKNKVNIFDNYLRANNFSDDYLTKLKNFAIKKKAYVIIISCLNILVERVKSKPNFIRVSSTFLSIILSVPDYSNNEKEWKILREDPTFSKLVGRWIIQNERNLISKDKLTFNHEPIIKKILKKL